MRILTLGEMAAVSGGGSLDSPGKSDAGYGGGSGTGRTGGSSGSSGSSGGSLGDYASEAVDHFGGIMGGLAGGALGSVGGPIAGAVGATAGAIAGQAFQEAMRDQLGIGRASDWGNSDRGRDSRADGGSRGGGQQCWLINQRLWQR